LSVARASPFSTSHTLTVFELPAASCRPSAEKATMKHKEYVRPWSSTSRVFLGPLRSHNCAPLWPPTARYRPSPGEKAMELGALGVLENVKSSSPEATSKSFTVMSRKAEAIRRPSG